MEAHALATPPDPVAGRGRTPGRSRRAEHGQALVEFAVMLPVMLTIMVGIAQYGIAFNNYLMLTDAVRVGARQLATIRGQSANPCLTAANKVKSSAFNLTSSSVNVSIVVNGTTYSTGTCANTTLTSGTDVTVTATYPCQIRIMGTTFAPNCTLRSQTTSRVE
ncbi:MAG: TadE/TadG family type IV pilus assembly protein [Acidobacteriota bacterium]